MKTVNFDVCIFQVRIMINLRGENSVDGPKEGNEGSFDCLYGG